MFWETTLVAAALAAVAEGAQPGAPAPVAAPMRDLEWGQVNFLHTTDIHGWLGGHLQEALYSADWGDYISFTEHMRQKANEQGVDLLVIDTGDRIEGNGLYDGSDPKGKYSYDIFREQSVDAVCTGNHELYQIDSVAREHNITVPNFKKSYIASNLDYIEPQTGDQIPQAQRYIKLKTKNQGLNVVALGFLFNFDRNANNSVVQPVEETLKEEWFKNAIREKPDLFLVIGHVGLRMKEFDLIFSAIRDQNWYTPIAFFGGHAHVRDAKKYDDKAFAIASGRYLETIGWMSVDGIKKSKDEVSAEASVSFKRRYIDNNLFGLHYHTGLNETTFPTEHGRNVSKMIMEGRKALDLDNAFGCAPQDLWMSRAEYPSNASIFTWLEEQVMPDAVVNKERADKPRLAILNTGAIRFDIFKGAFTKDSTYLISPFESKFNYIPDVPYAVASKVLHMLNNRGQVFGGSGLDTRYMTIPEQMAPRPSLFEEPVTAADEPQLRIFGGSGDQQIPLSSSSGDDKGTGKEPELVGGYTTKDDLGTDGDDAVHSPIRFFAVPNCVQSEAAFPEDGDPDTVDLVFIDYVQPWIIPALKFSGGDYSTNDVRVYLNSTLTDVIAGWVKEHWGDGDC
ncbi:Uu.00g116630.m01.CDS01 [Anthostomella pinea]|uniref:Uu.00g116630.m01.CDS01 n=1 Tax=Anthostomella pinea TaxID=933095 RepID=A0AAI8VH47_9PEZI|nr:Uu.00g116630.m01.CDS01 [Anthostomella pinea]